MFLSFFRNLIKNQKNEIIHDLKATQGVFTSKYLSLLDSLHVKPKQNAVKPNNEASFNIDLIDEHMLKLIINERKQTWLQEMILAEDLKQKKCLEELNVVETSIRNTGAISPKAMAELRKKRTILIEKLNSFNEEIKVLRDKCAIFASESKELQGKSKVLLLNS
jgi:hypothetical protein